MTLKRTTEDYVKTVFIYPEKEMCVAISWLHVYPFPAPPFLLPSNRSVKLSFSIWMTKERFI